MKTFKVTQECIACHACVEVAPEHFKMTDLSAFVYKQPQIETELQACREAENICPVEAIVSEEKSDSKEHAKPILAKSNIRDTLEKYPHLKEVLINYSEKFKKLTNPVMFNTLARFATFNDAARVTGISICELLHLLNKATDTEDLLHKIAPECIKESENSPENIFEDSETISWIESPERYIYNADSLTELIGKLNQLKSQQCLVFLSVANPIELVKTAKGLGYKVNIEKNREFRISVYNPQKEIATNWRNRKEEFEILDVRKMKTDPFDIIIKKAYSTPEDEGFVLVQRFEPVPMINMLSEMGFEYESQEVAFFEIWVYFYKIPVTETEQEKANKSEVVIQSATPVAYPVVMRLLQSEVIRKKIRIKELKVWEETEKHLAWITSGKADISFSALITAVKLQNVDIKIPALFVWDNFVILTNYKANGFEDIKGKAIYTPLFEEAPPTKITSYLIKALGHNPSDYNFAYGKPFGRPEEIYTAFVEGKADTVLLREPEASYALKIMSDRGKEVSILSFNTLWNQVNKGFGSFPNAGVVLKGEFARNNPELTTVFLQELQKAINWVNTHKMEAAKLSFDMMRQPTDRIELFLNRVNFNYVSGEALISKVKQYFDVLTKENIVENKIEDHFYDIFRLN